IPKTGKGSKKSRPVNKDRFVNKMFLRGDSVVLVLTAGPMGTQKSRIFCVSPGSKVSSLEPQQHSMSRTQQGETGPVGPP
ncbi:snRNP core protein D2, partial [Haematococcus lacustris]